MIFKSVCIPLPSTTEGEMSQQTGIPRWGRNLFGNKNVLWKYKTVDKDYAQRKVQYQLLNLTYKV